MNGSHTLLLLNEVFEKVQEFNYKRYIKEIESISRSISKTSLRGQKQKVNQILERIGLHLMYKSVFEEFQNNSYNNKDKWNSVGTLQLALKDPDKFNEAYNLFTDQDSKDTFDWFIKYRIAYAFVGENTVEIFPPPISKNKFFKELNNLKIERKSGVIHIQNYFLKTNPLEFIQSWIFEQYSLKEKCDVLQGDYIIDGGAFKGETSFWFLSKGAEKVYAFEPDPYNFLVLSENIIRNKVQDKVIPIQMLLLDKNGIYSMYITNSGGSTVIDTSNKIDAGNGKIETIKGITLDSFIESEALDRVDFIKLDVEGSELEVLRGSVETIKMFKPKMAISVYHKPEDIIAIPEFIYGILPDAKFYLSNRSCNSNETILFVNPRK